MRFTNWSSNHRYWAWAVVLCAIALVEIADLVNPSVDFMPYFWAPVLVAASFLRWKRVLLLSAVAATLSMTSGWWGSAMTLSDYLNRLALGVMFSLVAVLVSKQIQHRDGRLLTMAHTDSLTGLANRRTFDGWWNELNGVGKPAALLLIELQRMSVLVDGFGHQIGDEVLTFISAYLERTAAAVGARVARSDAGQFLVLALDHGHAEAEKLAKAFHSDLHGEIDALGVLFHPVLNIGVALRQEINETLASAVAEASAALTSLNRVGVGLTSFGDASAQSRAALELTMESALRKALQTRDVVAAMQPIYRIADGRIIGAEMLARWTWEEHEIPPGTFVTLAEHTGLISELSRQMRGHALQLLPQFIAAADGGSWCTWINVSPRELIEASFSDRLLAELQAADVDPSRIGIEVTETAMLTNPKTVEKTLRVLRQAGVSVALDDFGTGFSSLSILKDMEVDVVKIDRSFTEALPHDNRVAAIVAGIISTVTAMGSEVVAEGIESEEQLACLDELGCHSAQGFLLSRAVTPIDFLELMRQESIRLPVSP